MFRPRPDSRQPDVRPRSQRSRRPGRVRQRRRNLFELNPQLHPVLAKAIVQMTELTGIAGRRICAALLRTLENYRDQDVDFDFDLARIAELSSADRRGKRGADPVAPAATALRDFAAQSPAALSPDDADGQSHLGVGAAVVRRAEHPARADPDVESRFQAGRHRGRAGLAQQVSALRGGALSARPAR